MGREPLNAALLRAYRDSLVRAIHEASAGLSVPYALGGARSRHNVPISISATTTGRSWNLVIYGDRARLPRLGWCGTKHRRPPDLAYAAISFGLRLFPIDEPEAAAPRLAASRTGSRRAHQDLTRQATDEPRRDVLGPCTASCAALTRQTWNLRASMVPCKAMETAGRAKTAAYVTHHEPAGDCAPSTGDRSRRHPSPSSKY